MNGNKVSILGITPVGLNVHKVSEVRG